MKSKTKSAKVKAKGVFIVQNDKGMHTRPCTELVKCACNFQSNIFLKFQDHTVNGKSLLGILMLAAPKGAKVKVTVEGEDAEAALQDILELAQDSFHMKY